MTDVEVALGLSVAPLLIGLVCLVSLLFFRKGLAYWFTKPREIPEAIFDGAILVAISIAMFV